MKTYTNLKSILPLIPSRIKEDIGISQVLSYALNGYNELGLRDDLRDKVILLKLTNHKVQLPKNIKEIGLVTYMKNKPTKEDEDELQAVYSEEYEDYYLTHQLVIDRDFLNSNYFNNSFVPLKYIQGELDILCKECANVHCHDCSETYSVDKNKILTSSIKDGYLCVYYSTSQHENGEFYIRDIPEIKRYLSYYVQQMYAEEIMWNHETNSFNMAQKLSIQTATWHNKAYGAALLRGVNRPLNEEILTRSYNNSLFQNIPHEYRLKYYYE